MFRRFLFLTATLTVLGTPGLTAQESGLFRPSAVDELRAELDELVAKQRETQDRVEARRELEIEERQAIYRGQLDTVSVGPFQLISRSHETEAAQSIVSSIWRETVESLSLPDMSAYEFPYLVVVENTSDPHVSVVESSKVFVFLREWSSVGVGGPSEGHLRLIEQVRLALLPKSLQARTSVSPFRVNYDARYAARSVLLSPASRSANCMEGDNAMCLDLMNLMEAEIDPTMDPAQADQQRWDFAESRLQRIYTPEELREVARDVEACRPGIRMEFCYEAVSRRWMPFVEPLDATPRDALFRSALEMGGAEGLERLSQLPEDVQLIPALEALAGAPLDDILDEWRSMLLGQDLDSKPRPLQGQALIWVLLTGVFSLSSSRWRF